MITKYNSPPDGGTQEEASTDSTADKFPSLLGWICMIGCRWGLHNYSYNRTRCGGVILTEKCCMNCGIQNIEDPVPVTD